MSYAEANAEGRERANQLLETMRRTDAPALLGHVIEQMMKRGQFGGVEIGFFHVVSIELMQPPVTQFIEVPERPTYAGRKMAHLQVVG